MGSELMKKQKNKENVKEKNKNSENAYADYPILKRDFIYLTERERKLQQCIPSEHGLASGTKECAQPEVAKGMSNLTLTDDMKKAGTACKKDAPPGVYDLWGNKLEQCIPLEYSFVSGTKDSILSYNPKNSEGASQIKKKIKNPVYYSQTNSKWNQTMYSNHNDKKQTIGSSGCGPTAMAMVISTLLGKEVSPPDLGKYAVENGYRTNEDGTSHKFFPAVSEKYEINYVETTKLSELKEALSDGSHIAIAAMKRGHFTGYGHIIVLHGVETKNGKDWYDVLDPNSHNKHYGKDGLVDVGIKNDGRVKASADIFNKEATKFWVFHKASSVRKGE